MTQLREHLLESRKKQKEIENSKGSLRKYVISLGEPRLIEVRQRTAKIVGRKL